jgi:Glycosyltransferase
VPILNILAHDYDLTVAYSDGKLPNVDMEFHTHKLSTPKRFGPFLWNKDDISGLCDSFDVVIAVGEISRLKYSWQALRRHRRYRLIYWTIGVSASYTKRYDEVRRYDFIRDFFLKKADSCIFYSDYPVKKNLGRGYDKEHMFVANNTVVVAPTEDGAIKDSILFIGSLYRAKGLDVLLSQYAKAYAENANIPKLNIIGGGGEYDAIANWIDDNNLSEKVQLLGPIYDENVKSRYFARAYACISPNQAGLSVLESMGYGVPFVTMYNAYTGGERLNIVHMHNGVLMESADDLKDILLDIAFNSQKYIEMGHKAREYYNSYRTPQMMADGIKAAVDYCMSI